MWIAFRIVFLYSIHRCPYFGRVCKFVVNCFQNCIFIQHSQDPLTKWLYRISCELLSELYFYTAFTGFMTVKTGLDKLWIAFRIVFLYSIHRILVVCENTYCVVNCFQNCIFIQHSQADLDDNNSILVVNCFQNCIFIQHSQAVNSLLLILTCCELLSELYFYTAFTGRVCLSI